MISNLLNPKDIYTVLKFYKELLPSEFLLKAPHVLAGGICYNYFTKGKCLNAKQKKNIVRFISQELRVTERKIKKVNEEIEKSITSCTL